MSKHKEMNIHDKREDEQSSSSFAELADVLDVDLKSGADVTSAENLLKEINEANLKAQENWDKFMRTQAEMENLRKRAERDIANAHRYALEKFVAELPPILDSMEQGMEAAAATESGEGTEGAAGAPISAMREGIEMTYKMLLKAIEKFGVVQLNPLDQVYDPHQHEAMAAVPAPNVAPNTVIQVIQKGYSLHGRLIRPARVIVSKAED
ncbi:MAG: nucleotide exchange factor GrpE [Legionellales bacterium]|nr:nucleotide exchange factor GrpE [Legionellales bacterium]